MNPTAFDDNVKKALKCADDVIQSVNETLAVATSSNVPTSEKNTDTLIRELEAAAVAPTQAALSQQTMEAAGKEVKKIMSEGFNEFKRQTGRNMTYSEMRHAYG